MQNLVLKIAVLMGVIGGSCVVVWKAHESLNSVVSSQMSADKFVAFDEKVGSSAAQPEDSKKSPEVELEPTLAEPEPTLAATSPATASLLATRESTSASSSRLLSSPSMASLAPAAANEGKPTEVPSETSAVPNFFAAAEIERSAAPLNRETPEADDSKLMAARAAAPAQSEESASPDQDPFASASSLAAKNANADGSTSNRRFPALPEPEPLPENMAARAAPLASNAEVSPGEATPAASTGEVDPFAVLGLNSPQPAKLTTEPADSQATASANSLELPAAMPLASAAPEQSENAPLENASAETPAVKNPLEAETPLLTGPSETKDSLAESDPFQAMPAREREVPSRDAPALSLEGGELEPAPSKTPLNSPAGLAMQAAPAVLPAQSESEPAEIQPADALNVSQPEAQTEPQMTPKELPAELLAVQPAQGGAPVSNTSPSMPGLLRLPVTSPAEEGEESTPRSFRANEPAPARSRVMQANAVEEFRGDAPREILPTSAAEPSPEPAPFLAIRPKTDVPTNPPAMLPADLPSRSAPSALADWAKDASAGPVPTPTLSLPPAGAEGEKAMERSRMSWSENFTVKEETSSQTIQSHGMQIQSEQSRSSDLLALQTQMEPLTREAPSLPPATPALASRMTKEVLPSQNEEEGTVPTSLFAPELPETSRSESSRAMLASAQVEEVLPELPEVTPTPAAKPMAVPEAPPQSPSLPATPPAVPALPMTPSIAPAMPPAIPALPATPPATPSVTPTPLPITTPAPSLETTTPQPLIPAPAMPTADPAKPTPVTTPTLTPTEPPQAMPARSSFPSEALPQTPGLELGRSTTTETVAAAPASPLAAEMKIERSAPPEAVVGEPVIYSILIRNVGSADAKDVVVEDRVPKGTQLEGTIPQAYLNDGKLSWQLGTVKVGEERKIQLKVIPLESGQIGSVATVSFAASAPAKMQVQAPELFISMSGPSEATLGDHATFQFKLSNRGKGAAKSVFLRAVLPQGIRHPGGNDLEYEAGTLEPGSERIINLSVTPESVGAFTIMAQISNENKTAGETRADLRVIQSRLELTRTGPENRFVGRPTTFVTRVTNHSSQTLNNVTIQEKIPEDVELAAVPRSGRWDAKTRLVTWTIPTIEPGQSLELNSLYVVNRGGIHEGKLVAVDEFGNRTEIITSMNAKGFSELKTDVTATHRTVFVGERVSYRLTLKNVGTDTAFEVRPRFVFPVGFEFANAAGPTKYNVSGQVVEFQPLTELTATGERIFELSLIANAPGTSKVTVQLMTADMGEPLQIDQPVRVVANNP